MQNYIVFMRVCVCVRLTQTGPLRCSLCILSRNLRRFITDEVRSLQGSLC